MQGSLSPTFYRRIGQLEVSREDANELSEEDVLEDEPPTLRMLTRDERASVERMEEKLTSNRASRGFAGSSFGTGFVTSPLREKSWKASVNWHASAPS